jgi:hypothetical protein
MGDPGRYRDSTEIVVPRSVLERYVDEVESRFTVTVFEKEDTARIIGSPLVIKQVNEFLSRQGVNLP